MHRYLVVGEISILREKIPAIFWAVESEEKLSSDLYDDLEGVRLKKVTDHGWNKYCELVEMTDNPVVFLDIWKDYQ
jgi:hypothetical protein